MTDGAPVLVGQRFPGHDARGISLPGFLKAFPDDASCMDFLFWVRGGHQTRCPRCGRFTIWRRFKHYPTFLSGCCRQRLSATKGTWFFRSGSLWEWFYTIILVLNLSASPSVFFLARHLGVSTGSSRTWLRLQKIRQHIADICAHASRSLRGQTVHAELLLLPNVLSRRLGKTRRASVLVVATEIDVFAFQVPVRAPVYFKRILDGLEVAPDIYTFDRKLAAFDGRLKGYRVHDISHWSEQEAPAIWRCFAKGRSFAVYLVRSLNRKFGWVSRTHFQTYLAEFVFRFNFAQDKAMLFPLFMTHLPRAG